MILSNEIYLWRNINNNNSARKVLNDMLDKGMINSYKQGVRTLEKWSDNEIYDYDVCLDLGWKVCHSTPIVFYNRLEW